MTRDDIIRMARKSGFAHGICWAAHEKDLLMFANLVAAAEREECAKVCEQPIDEIQITDDCSELVYMGGKECAFAIRERGAP